MRKFVAYIMVFSFIVAIFDVVDIYDLRHQDGTTIFSTHNPHADNAPDSLDDQGLEYTIVHNLFLPSVFQVCQVKRTIIKAPLIFSKNNFFYHHIPGLTNRPPMA